ncbi:dsDNA nuclease domain-containing protein [Dactylosporangium siamense]|uniref:CD-NTase associated protein 4-like DNA endonuclease domain-containing protein n=1 Tax=Dactylosporangium siamense TaxID=685454 RepID=A0A919Q270_9ACTN|nr:hypothetical protein [Dactylosporangium siamense]GIG52908.1 hypothetical protein Dsi01nite_109490 [Dactylosporangium siamense]
MTVAEDPLGVVAGEDSGADTQDRYAWQHHCTAVDCAEMFRSGRAQLVVTEIHEDYVVVFVDGRTEFVSCKHREQSQGPWDLISLCNEGGLAHLFDRFVRFPELALRLMTNASLKPGALEAAGVWAACMRAADGELFTDSTLTACRDALARGLLAARHTRTFEGIPVTPRPGRGGRTARLAIPDGFLPLVERFMRVLMIRADLPQRQYIGPVHVSKVMRSALEALGYDGDAAQLCYDRLVDLVALRNIGQPLTNDYAGWLTSRSTGTTSGAQAALVEARTIRRDDVTELIRLHAGQHRAPVQLDARSDERRIRRLLRELGLGGAGSITALGDVDVGEGAGDLQDDFDIAFEAAGGERRLGAPLALAVPVGPGFAQAFSADGQAVSSVICAAPGRAGAVLPASIWLALRQYQGGAGRGAGFDNLGLPGGTGEHPNVVDPQSSSVDLFGGSWAKRSAFLRLAVEGRWSWRPAMALDFEGPHRRHWTPSVPSDLRLRAVARLPWPNLHANDLTASRRARLQRTLSRSGLSYAAAALTLRRGAVGAPGEWMVASGIDAFGTDRTVHLRAALLAPDGAAALVNEVILSVPSGPSPDHILACASLSIWLDPWLRAVLARGGMLEKVEDLRLSLGELIHVLDAAWASVIDVVPIGALDDPPATALFGAPTVELHIDTPTRVETPTDRSRTLPDAVDMSLLGLAIRTEQHTTAGFRIVTPLATAGDTRQQWLADGLAQLGRSWGHPDADAGVLLASL